MASKRRLRRRQCTRKDKLTKAGAQARERALRRKDAESPSGASRHPMDAYPCGDHWHVGHRPRKVQQLINLRRRERREQA